MSYALDMGLWVLISVLKNLEYSCYLLFLSVIVGVISSKVKTEILH